MKILQVEDKYRSDIRLNERLVHTLDTNTIQVERKLLKQHKENSLYILHKVPPKLCVDYLSNKQIVDIPQELIEVLVLGMAVKAHGMGALTNDPRTGTSYVQNPYIDRYELAIKKVLDYGYLPPTRINTRTITTKGFI